MWLVLKKSILAFVLGVLVFTPWEALMARLEIVQYMHPDFMGISWWSPLGFGLAVSFAMLCFVKFDQFFHFKISCSKKTLFLEYLWLVLFYSLILLFRSFPYLLSLSLFILMLLRLVFFYQPGDILVFLIGACLGPTFKLIFTSFNLYFFTEPDFLGIPYWSPLLWGTAAVSLRRLSWFLFPLLESSRLYAMKF